MNEYFVLPVLDESMPRYSTWFCTGLASESVSSSCWMPDSGMAFWRNACEEWSRDVELIRLISSSTSSPGRWRPSCGTCRRSGPPSGGAVGGGGPRGRAAAGGSSRGSRRRGSSPGWSWRSSCPLP